MQVQNICCVAIAVAITLGSKGWCGEPITYRLAEEGRVSMAVFDAAGVQVRTLMSAVPHVAGEHACLWDGLDRQGRPVPAGEYTWKLLQTAGLESKYLMSLGTSVGQMHWPGSHNGPAAVAVDPRRGHVYMAAGAVEGGAQLVKMTLDGKILWSHRAYEPWAHLRDMAFDGAPCSVGENEYPQGALYVPHCNSGNLHVADVRGGDAAVPREMVKQYVAEGRVEPLLAPMVRLDFGPEGSEVEQGWLPAAIARYDDKLGFGWDNTDGLTAAATVDGGALERDGHAFAADGPAGREQRRAFLVKVPEGCRFCTVRVLLGGEKPCHEVEIYSGLSYGKPKRVATADTAAGECKVIEFQPKPKGLLDVTFGNRDGSQPAGWSVRAIEVLVTADRLDAHAGKIMAAFSYAGRIRQVAPRDWRPLGETLVPELRDVAVLDDGTVLAISGDKVVLVDEGGSGHKPLISGLAEPICLSVDRATGELFVVEWGASHRIKRFSRDYKLLGTCGGEGGRREGLYRPEDFMNVADVAGDGRGGFFIVEHWVAPRRLAHFDDRGRLIRQWYGGQQFFTNASLDEKNRRRVWFDSHFGWTIEAEVDWEQGDWRPHATYKFAGLADGLVPVAPGGNYWMLRRRDGERYLVYTRCPGVLRVDEENGRLLPLVFSDLNVASLGDSPVLASLSAGGKGKWKSYLWTDTSGDGRPQKGEFVLSKWGVFGLRWFVDRDFTYYGVYAPREPDGDGLYYAVCVLAPEWRGGLPFYPPFEKAGEIRLDADETFRQQAGRLAEPKSFYRDPEGNCYLIVHGGGDAFTARGASNLGHGFRWPSDLIDGTAVAKWDGRGRLLWKVGPHASERESHLRGRLHFPTKIAGRAHGCIGVQDRIALPLEVWTEDGLYAGGLFDRRADDGLPDTCYHWFRVRHDIEDFEEARDLDNTAVLQYDMNAGGEITPYGDREALFLGGGWNNLPTYRVSGWNRFVRHQGTVRITRPASSAAGQGSGLRGEYFANVQLSGEPELRRVDRQIWFGTEGKNQLEKPWPDHSVTKRPFSARWSGWIEPRFTETYRFSVYLGREAGGAADKVRLWVDGRLILDAWDQADGSDLKRRSSLVAFDAGQRVPIRLEYAASSGSGELHLCWESAGEEIGHVASACLYPDPPKETTR